MAQPQIPMLKQTCQTLDQKISNSQPGNIVVTQSDIPNNFIRKLALHLLNEFEDAEERLKKVHGKVEDLGGCDQLTDWRADGNFKGVAGMDALNDGGLQAYLLHILVPKIVGMKAEVAQKEVQVEKEKDGK
ncbi:hypothetical protein AC579_9287 [Pseudocercospora musae]|uniref:Uncharacterized protein n=1 Tax=Pseudocercospora musae TaxID=113226 RepID=A0A139HEN0_9PEZI|nr:hypothetical protein AC579_9287 [Pseudocercospora musae]